MDGERRHLFHRVGGSSDRVRVIDYMALRRDEDAHAAAVLGARPIHLPLAEAPHRGYASAAELFTGVHDGDPAAAALRDVLPDYLHDADLVLAPQALGSHVDHVLVAEAVAALVPAALWWRDMPYASRPPAVEQDWTHKVAVDISGVLTRKVEAAQCYSTQLHFRFGGPERAGQALGDWAAAEAARRGQGSAAEVLIETEQQSWPL